MCYSKKPLLRLWKIKDPVKVSFFLLEHLSSPRKPKKLHGLQNVISRNALPKDHPPPLPPLPLSVISHTLTYPHSFFLASAQCYQLSLNLVSITKVLAVFHSRDFPNLANSLSTNGFDLKLLTPSIRIQWNLIWNIILFNFVYMNYLQRGRNIQDQIFISMYWFDISINIFQNCIRFIKNGL